MPVSDGDIIRIVCKFSIGEDDLQNVYHARVDAGTPIDDAVFLSEMADDIDNMYGDLELATSQNVDFDSIEMYNITDDSYVGETSWPTLIDGGNASNQLPVQTAPLVLFLTPFLRSVGRKFLLPATTALIDADGSPSNVLLGFIADFVVEVLDTKTGTGWSAVLGNWSASLDRFAEWTESVVRDLFATQRRRYYGRGS